MASEDQRLKLFDNKLQIYEQETERFAKMDLKETGVASLTKECVEISKCFDIVARMDAEKKQNLDEQKREISDKNILNNKKIDKRASLILDMQRLIQENIDLENNLKEQSQMVKTAKEKQLKCEVVWEDLKKKIQQIKEDQQGMESQFGQSIINPILKKLKKMQGQFKELKAIKDIDKKYLSALKENTCEEFNIYTMIQNTLDDEIKHLTFMAQAESRSIIDQDVSMNVMEKSLREGASSASSQRDNETLSEEEELAVDGSNIFLKTDRKGFKVTVENIGKSEINVSGWKIVHADACLQNRQIFYKFGRGTKIPANTNLVLWACNSGAKHDPPFHIVSKHSKVPPSNYTHTILEDLDSKEIATFIEETDGQSSGEE